MTHTSVVRLAKNRLNAVRNGRSIRSIMDSANGGVSIESIKEKVDAEVQAAKEAGLNFNIICNLWMFDIGIEAGDILNVSKFLNRCLGLRLNKQRLMTNYFLKYLQSEIYSAKSSGKLIDMFSRNSNTINSYIHC